MKRNLRTLSALAAGLAIYGRLCNSAQGGAITEDLQITDNLGHTYTAPITTSGGISYNNANWYGWDFQLTVAGITGGSASQPHMDVSAQQITGGPGTLTIDFTTINLGPTAGGVESRLTGSSTGSSITAQVLADAGNGYFTGAAVTPIQGLGATVSGSLTMAAPYSLTLQDIISAPGADEMSSLDQLVTVPDGSMTFSLLGFALMGVEGLRRRLAKLGQAHAFRCGT